MKRFMFVAFACAAAVHCSLATAQAYPVKPVKIVAAAAGGYADLLPRLLAARMQERTGQPWIVEPRLGANGVIAAEYVMKSPPDGYTLLMSFTGLFSVLPALGAKLPFDVNKDFEPVVLLATVPNVLVVNPSVPAQSVKDVIALAKSRPDSLTYASQGVGSSGHIAGEQFKQLTGTSILHIPYKGAAPAIQDLLGGRVSMLFDALPLAVQNIRAGKVRALALVATSRSKVIPDVPTMVEAGVSGMVADAWFGLYGPAGMPSSVVTFLNREANAIFSTPEVRDPLIGQGASIPLGTPADLRNFVASRTETWTKIAREASIKLED
jgi:tripartite-type tricarboxylate transporter receptor subunit TctC